MRKSIAQVKRYELVARFFCLLAVVGVPLILRLKVVSVADDIEHYFPGWTFEFDIFTYWKVKILWVLAALSIATLSFRKISLSNSLGIEFRAPLFGYIFLLILSSIFSNHPDLAWYGMPNYQEGAFVILAYLALFFVSTVVFRAENHLKQLEIALKCLVFAVMIIGFFEYHCDNFLGSTIIKRLILGENWAMYNIGIYTYPLFVTLMNSNLLGTFCATLFPYFLVKKDAPSWYATVGLIFLAIGSESRGCWISMIVTMVIVGVINTADKRIVAWFAKLFIYALATCGVIYVIATGVHRPDLKSKLTLNSSGRFYVWDTTLKMIQRDETFFLGMGPSVYAIKFPQDGELAKEAGWPENTLVDRPHSFYLQVAYASGVLSLLFLVYLFAQFLIPAYIRCLEYPDSSNHLLSILGSVIGYLINVLFTDSWVGVAPVFWVILGAGVGLIEKYRIRLKV